MMSDLFMLSEFDNASILGVAEFSSSRLSMLLGDIALQLLNSNWLAPRDRHRRKAHEG